MSELTMERLRENLDNLKMRNTLEILDNYLELAIKGNLNIVDVLNHIFAEEAQNKRKHAYEKQVQMSGFPIKKTLDDANYSYRAGSTEVYSSPGYPICRLPAPF